VIGKWRQVSDNAGADFLLGGYTKSGFTFRADGVLEVHRTFDKAGEVSLVWRVGYSWNKSMSKLTLGTDPDERPKPGSLKGFTIEESGVKALDATDTLPLVIRCRRPKDGVIMLGDKVYSPVR